MIIVVINIRPSPGRAARRVPLLPIEWEFLSAAIRITWLAPNLVFPYLSRFIKGGCSGNRV